VSQQLGRESINAFTTRMVDFAEAHDAERLVVDLRANHGGNQRRVSALVERIGRAASNNARGRLFVLMGRKTYSSAVVYASMLANNTRAVFVGEPTGQGPRFYSVASVVELPHSRLEFEISSMATEGSVAGDDRPWLEPDVRVAYTVEDFLEARDPALEAALAYEAMPVAALPVHEDLITAYAGRYRFGPCQILTIARTRDGLHLTIDDFLVASSMTVSTALHPVADTLFRTDIADVLVGGSPGPGGTVSALRVEWKGRTTVAPRAPEGFRTPMERIVEGDVAAGVEGLLEARDQYHGHFGNLEFSLRDTGNEFLRGERYRDAIAVFAANVELFPGSSDARANLARAYLESGVPVQRF
jgi:hypothetical protein